MVHKHVAHDRSPFLEACLQEGFKEGQEQKITIKDWDADQSMQLLVAWLYQGKEALQFTSASNDVDTKRSSTFATQQQLTKLYLLADRFLISKLKNDVIDYLDDNGPRQRLSVWAMGMLWADGPAECHLKTYILHKTARDLKRRSKRNEALAEGQKERLPTKLIKLIGDYPEFAQALVEMMVAGAPEYHDISRYYEHDGEEEDRTTKAEEEHTVTMASELIDDGSSGTEEL